MFIVPPCLTSVIHILSRVDIHVYSRLQSPQDCRASNQIAQNIQHEKQHDWRIVYFTERERNASTATKHLPYRLVHVLISHCMILDSIV